MTELNVTELYLVLLLSHATIYVLKLSNYTALLMSRINRKLK